MPRLNEERTEELHAWQAHEKYLADHFEGYSINDGWAVDTIEGTITSKVYNWGYVTTSMRSPYYTTATKYEEMECAGS